VEKVIHVIQSIANIGGHFSASLVVLMMALVLFEVFMRYVVNRPPIIADELSAYMLVVVAFIGTAYCWKERGHMRIELFASRLPTRVSNWLRLVTLLMLFTFTVVLVKGSFGFLAYSFRVHQTSATWLRVPLQIPQMALAIGFILLSLLVLVGIVKAIMDIRSGRRIEEAAR